MQKFIIFLIVRFQCLCIFIVVIRNSRDDEHQETRFAIAEICLGMVEQYAPFMRVHSSLSASRFSLVVSVKRYSECNDDAAPHRADPLAIIANASIPHKRCINAIRAGDLESRTGRTAVRVADEGSEERRAKEKSGCTTRRRAWKNERRGRGRKSRADGEKGMKMRKRQEGSQRGFYGETSLTNPGALIFFFSISLFLLVMFISTWERKERKRARNTQSTLQILKPRRVNPVTLRCIVRRATVSFLYRDSTFIRYAKKQSSGYLQLYENLRLFPISRRYSRLY